MHYIFLCFRDCLLFFFVYFKILSMKGLPRFPHEMILEGGSIHVDGEGKKFHCFSSFTANSFVKNLYFLHTLSCDQLRECISPPQPSESFIPQHPKIVKMNFMISQIGCLTVFFAVHVLILILDEWFIHDFDLST